MKIIAILNEADSVEACLQATASAAVAVPTAIIEALRIVVDPEKIIAASEEIEFQRMREEREGTAAEKCAAVKAAFDAWALAHRDVVIQWRTLVAQEEEGLIQAARDADLLVMARSHDMDTGDAFHAALMRLDKPLLLVPHGPRQYEGNGFATVAIGVADTSAEHHALLAARPWLEAASHIVALRIGEDGVGSALLDVGLGSLPVQERVAPSKAGENLGAQIAAEASAAGADLLVCGAYRHNQLIEWLIGGTTRHLLDAATMPILLAH